MSEQVVSSFPGVTWNPNAPDAVLISTDQGISTLALNAHPDDPDRRGVVFVWKGVEVASMGAPNDEAISGHRLYDRGLCDVTWVGVVNQSELVASLESQNRVHPMHDPARFAGLTHHVLPLKENLVEVVAGSVDVLRLDGPTMRAAAASLAP
jgi:hypothetical protein